MSEQLPILATLQERFKFIRKKRGLSQDALAKMLNVSQQSIEKLENGGVQMPKYLYRAAEVMDVSYQWLANGLIAYDIPEEESKKQAMNEEKQEFLEIMRKIDDPEMMRKLKDQLLSEMLRKSKSDRTD